MKLQMSRLKFKVTVLDFLVFSHTFVSFGARDCANISIIWKKHRNVQNYEEKNVY